MSLERLYEQWFGHQRVIFRFRCPVCRHVIGSDQEYEPLCTGPNWTDDHEPTVMERVPAR